MYKRQLRTREEALLQLGQIAPVEQNALAEYLKKLALYASKFDYFNSCGLSFINYLFVIFPIDVYKRQVFWGLP